MRMCLLFLRMLGDDADICVRTFNNIILYPPQEGVSCSHRAGHVAGHVIHMTLPWTTCSTLHFTPKHVQTCLLRHITIIFRLNPIVRHGYGRCTAATDNQPARNRYPYIAYNAHLIRLITRYDASCERSHKGTA